MKPVLKAVNVHKQFGASAVLRGVHFELERGQVHAVLGSNGAGKSTLMNIFSGILAPDSGELLLDGVPCYFSDARAARREGIAMVHQELSLVPAMTVAENIFLTRWNDGWTKFVDEAAMMRAAAALLARFEIVLDPQQAVSELTRAQQQLLEIAKALSGKVRVLILDEPSANLSAAELELLYQTVRRLSLQGLAIIYITHRLRDVFEVCNALSILRDGRIQHMLPVDATSPQAVLTLLAAQLPADWVPRKHMPMQEAAPLLQLHAKDERHPALTVVPGQIVGLSGDSASALLETIFGLQPLTDYTLSLCGHAVQISHPSEAITHGLHLVPGDRRRAGLVMDLSVSENILLSLFERISSSLLIDEARGQRIVSGLLHRLGWRADDPAREARELSGGHQQKVLMARALSTEGRILLLDEPGSGMDVQAQAMLWQTVRHYAEQGNAVLMASTDAAMLAAVCDTCHVVDSNGIGPPLAAAAGQHALLGALHGTPVVTRYQ
ncbi:monosaccharide ABC transporter ATP-binding protein, CUT2 family [Duganella sacchari]|uniref:Monosaccharide ABC transporter ATP-binding protein, CUT2 family n=1 Tax=Duganella sacchari TaxID=551987 RepID=A0A1M7REU3_9BURK|nr:sugar ABC transporter ATP-binding protein [Duganella sacchari]SHN44702.1 monosaccharide ABC transporter ATP-binding protein, CUT2 family [Duganella sacchari]